jgi:protein-disulfide isomerase
LGGAFRHGAAGLSALILVALTAGAAVYFPKEGTRPQPQAQAPTQQVSQDFATSWAQQPRVDLGIKADGASVIVVKFNDYQCPGCRETHEWYKPVLAKFEASHPGAVKYIVKDWPWDKKCNFNTAADMHPGACAGAAAVRIAREFGAAKEQEMEAWLFANQRPPATHDAVKSAAERILGIKDFDSLYAAKLPDIRRDIADGGALSINSTPTLFINGVRVEQLMPAYFFELAIQLELNKAGK